MSARQLEPIQCATYTHARRYPKVIGKLHGWTPWWGPWTLTQYGVLLGSFLLLRLTSPIWAHFGPLNLAFQVGLPFLLGWAVRAAKMEGRAPWRTGLGYLTLLATPPGGRHRGRPMRQATAHRLVGGWVFVGELEPSPLGEPPLTPRQRRKYRTTRKER